MTRVANIISTGRYLPDRIISNEEIYEKFVPLGHKDLLDAFLETGILNRHEAPADWATSDMCVAAAKQALERAGKTAEEVDLIIVATDTPDYITPATSTVVQKKLGAINAGTFDIGCACASFPTGLITSAGLIATNENFKNVLMIGAYMMRRLTAPDDPMLFFYSDGASAVLIQAEEMQGYIGGAMEADGAYYDQWGIYSGGTAEPASKESIEAGRTQCKYVGFYPQSINREGWPRIARRICRENHLEVDDIDHFIFTQVRRPAIEDAMKNLGAPVEKAHMIMDKWGYLGSACIGAALDDAVQNKVIKKGEVVMLVGSGVGYNQSGVAYRISHNLAV